MNSHLCTVKQLVVAVPEKGDPGGEQDGTCIRREQFRKLRPLCSENRRPRQD